jgi:hypothetical protein
MMNVEQRHHGNWSRNIELDVVCKTNQHIGPFFLKATGADPESLCPFEHRAAVGELRI